jgi:hypothetical protein
MKLHEETNKILQVKHMLLLGHMWTAYFKF